MRHGIASSRSRADATNWRIWATFCADLGIPTDLQGIDDPIPVLQTSQSAFDLASWQQRAKRLRNAKWSNTSAPSARSSPAWGATDPRLDRMGKVDFRLRRQLTCYEKEDPPPTRVRPVPITLLLDMHKRSL